MFCDNCGSQLEESQNFCSKCGKQKLTSRISEQKTTPTFEQGKDVLASEVITLIKIIAISVAIGLIAIPIALKDNASYSQGILPFDSDIQGYIQSNKTAHMKRIFTSSLLYSFFIIAIGRYVYLLVNWANKRQNN